ncbi:hypothetical protein PsYK624_047920 [Phanerochaete sordida]|uniref:Uncharacterized protein n=1 Tax=Phanerochaete sordida TaxID=48140 RepID=A0A9P3G6E8_9APHY|nr:hypothetical protein PsYK624_047920 [Phanerochaete sordida]
MSNNRPTFIDYSSPASEKSIYFDAPLMHIFSKRSSTAGDAPEEGHVAPPPASQSKIRSTTPLSPSQEPSPASAPGPLPDAPGATPMPQPHTNDEPALSDDDNAVLSRDYGASKPRQGSASTYGGTASDSGYGSPTPRAKPLHDDMQPIPVIWGGDGDGPRPTEKAGGADTRRSHSMRSFRSAGSRRDDGEGQSVHTSGRYTPAQRSRRVSMSGGAFAEGAGTVGPAAEADPEQTGLFRSRSVSAETALSKKQKLRISKEELKDGRKLAKVIQKEAKVEKRALEAAVRELTELQKLQKYAVKEEAKTNASYGHALQIFHKEELAFLAAQAKFERAKADLMAHEDAREAAREHAQQATEMLQEKSREVEWLRAQKAADDREREAKIRQLKGKA